MQRKLVEDTVLMINSDNKNIYTFLASLSLSLMQKEDGKYKIMIVLTKVNKVINKYTFGQVLSYHILDISLFVMIHQMMGKRYFIFW